MKIVYRINQTGIVKAIRNTDVHTPDAVPRIRQRPFTTFDQPKISLKGPTSTGKDVISRATCGTRCVPASHPRRFALSRHCHFNHRRKLQFPSDGASSLVLYLPFFALMMLLQLYGIVTHEMHSSTNPLRQVRFPHSCLMQSVDREVVLDPSRIHRRLRSLHPPLPLPLRPCHDSHSRPRITQGTDLLDVPCAAPRARWRFEVGTGELAFPGS